MAKKQPPKEPQHPVNLDGEESLLLEYSEDGTMVRVVELDDPQDTRKEDAKNIAKLTEIEYYEQFPPKKKPPSGYAAPRFDTRQQKRFLDKLACTGTMTNACAWTPVTRKTIQEWRKKSKPFNKLCEQALATYTDTLEEELKRRAVKGVKRPIFQKGVLVGHERVYSDRLMELTMKKHDPAYKDKLDVTGNITGGVLVVAPVAKDQQEWEERYGGLRRPEGENGHNQQGKEKEVQEEQGKKKKVQVITRA